MEVKKQARENKLEKLPTSSNPSVLEKQKKKGVAVFST